MSDQISPFNEEEKSVEFGGGVIPTKLANTLLPFLNRDLAEGIKYSLKESPREILMDTISKKEWFKGIVLSVAFFEHFASALLYKFTNGGINNGELNLGIERLLRLLLDNGIVSKEIHSKMHEIKLTRNKLVHNPFTEIDESKAEKLVKRSIEVLESLGVAEKKRE